ncbi:secondary thiamine-phosphate synthase enzyme [Alkalispirochaeta americana]|uniref:Secondary thiamine-phosphate synthase enzyme n=1 Tax=Alkalispirochaeta americana TaxID=159291 RepID=A0A1N6UYA7_9SPIO|nr:secondary thiamine-phosphate synthase enzyme YjbQ [Alkalispirochaeta americana]SIQ70610.1 secondary thiamine-phosphate synthase enzyme [Alkalispirochaeta americana]
MRIVQDFVTLKPRPRGFHIITHEVERGISGLSPVRQGLAQVMILHTSAGLTLNENADPDVRYDFSGIFDRLVPEGHPSYIHTLEGSDDMPAHAKSSLVGSSVTIPVREGAFVLGTWQGIYLCEFRDHGGPRRLVVTVLGE